MPAQLVGSFSLSGFQDKPWSQVCSRLPPGTCLCFDRAYVPIFLLVEFRRIVVHCSLFRRVVHCPVGRLLLCCLGRSIAPSVGTPFGTSFHRSVRRSVCRYIVPSPVYFPSVGTSFRRPVHHPVGRYIVPSVGISHRRSVVRYIAPSVGTWLS